MEGPYRDLGSGFARLTGAEGLRRGPSRISSVEDALFELLRNSRDAGARNIYVASVLNKRRYRTLLVLDDGAGIPEPFKELVFEPGVTSHHLPPETGPGRQTGSLNASGLSLHHIKNMAIAATVPNTSNPTTVKVTFDTDKLPENSLQSNSRASKSNLEATIRNFLYHDPNTPTKTRVFFSTPSRILATLLKNRIILRTDTNTLSDKVRSLGFRVSGRTLQRIKRGDVRPVDEVRRENFGEEGNLDHEIEGRHSGSGSITLDTREKREITAILAQAARKSYLEIGPVSFHSRSGKINLNAQLYEPEDEYE